MFQQHQKASHGYGMQLSKNKIPTISNEKLSISNKKPSISIETLDFDQKTWYFKLKALKY